MTALITALIRSAVDQVRVNWLTTRHYARCAKFGVLPSTLNRANYSNNIVTFTRP